MLECKCGEVVTAFDIFYEEDGKFRIHLYTCPKCQSCKAIIHYDNGKVKEINGFMK